MLKIIIKKTAYQRKVECNKDIIVDHPSKLTYKTIKLIRVRFKHKCVIEVVLHSAVYAHFSIWKLLPQFGHCQQRAYEYGNINRTVHRENKLSSSSFGL